MNNLPLKALPWDGDMLDTPLHTYQYLKDHDSKGKYMVKYAGKNRSLNEPARGFTTIDEAKAWAWKHYNEKMQPYVKPMPTWIDASKQLPQVDKDTQFICAYDSALEPFVRVGFFNVELGGFDYEHNSVIAWMPIPEFSEVKDD